MKTKKKKKKKMMMKKIWKQREQVKPPGFEPPQRVAYNNRKHLKFWESALFSG